MTGGYSGVKYNPLREDAIPPTALEEHLERDRQRRAQRRGGNGNPFARFGG